MTDVPGQVFEDDPADPTMQALEESVPSAQRVDFPKIVGELIQSVFRAIVDSSLQQIRAYGELIANVARSADQSAQDDIEDSVRDWLAGTYPDALGVGVSQTGGCLNSMRAAQQPGKRVLRAKGDNPQRLTDISRALGMDEPVTDISDPDEEARLVIAARVQIARERRQLLASMVLMGVNRVVVTDGTIAAKITWRTTP